MHIIDQFSIWEVSLEKKAVGHEQAGDRPFFVISTLDYNIKSGTPIGFIMSASPKKAQNDFIIKVNGMTSTFSHVNISQARTLDLSRFKKSIMTADRKTGLSIISKFIEKITCSSKGEFLEQISALKSI